MTRALGLGLILLLALASACGYSTGLTLPDDYRTVGVEVFGNDTRVPDLEARMQEQLTASVRSRVDAPLVEPERADLIIRGTLLNYDRRSGIRSPENQLLETGVRIAIEAELVRRPAATLDTQSGKKPKDVVLRSVRFNDESGFRLDQDPLNLGELAASNRVLRRLSDRIVMELMIPVVYERPEPKRD